MNRRSFLKGLVGVTGAAIAAPDLLVPEKRFWQLDKTMTVALPKQYHWVSPLSFHASVEDDGVTFLQPVDEVEWRQGDIDSGELRGLRSIDITIVPHRQFDVNKWEVFYDEQQKVLVEERARVRNGELMEKIRKELEGWR